VRQRRVTSSQAPSVQGKSLTATSVATASAGGHTRSRQRQATAAPSTRKGPIAPRIAPNRNGQEMSHMAWQRQSRTPSRRSASHIAPNPRTV
jgi:hypothetical protein